MPRGVKKDPILEILQEIGDVQKALTTAREFKTGQLDKTQIKKICELAVLGGKYKLAELVEDLE